MTPANHFSSLSLRAAYRTNFRLCLTKNMKIHLQLSKCTFEEMLKHNRTKKLAESSRRDQKDENKGKLGCDSLSVSAYFLRQNNLASSRYKSH